jgi:AcrR family transcriptional regulator
VEKGARRQQILAHARDVFARRGYHEAKIDEIVAMAGVARGTFYLYFEDKRAVFEEIVDRAFTQIGLAIMRVDPADPARSVADQIRENIRRLVRTLIEDRETTKILLSGAMGVDPAFDRKLRSFYNVVEQLLAESLAEGQELGVVARGDARMMAFLTMGAMKEILFQMVHRDAEYTLEEVVKGIFDFLSHGTLRVSRASRPSSGRADMSRSSSDRADMSRPSSDRADMPRPSSDRADMPRPSGGRANMTDARAEPGATLKPRRQK